MVIRVLVLMCLVGWLFLHKIAYGDFTQHVPAGMGVSLSLYLLGTEWTPPCIGSSQHPNVFSSTSFCEKI